MELFGNILLSVAALLLFMYGFEFVYRGVSGRDPNRWFYTIGGTLAALLGISFFVYAEFWIWL